MVFEGVENHFIASIQVVMDFRRGLCEDCTVADRRQGDYEHNLFMIICTNNFLKPGGMCASSRAMTLPG